MKTKNKLEEIPEDPDFKDSWTLENAIYVLQHPTVDSDIWSEAVEWLMLHGPENIKKLLLSSSRHATEIHFPELRPKGYTPDGQPCYDIEEIASSLGMDAADVRDLLSRKERNHDRQHGFEDSDIGKIH